MARKLDVWSRIAYMLDAFSLMKLICVSVLFVLFDGSPLFALGIVFAAPVIAACSMAIVRLLRQAASGERVDYSFPDDGWHKERASALFWRRERPCARSFVSTYRDVTPIKYRRVRTSAGR